MKCAVLIDWLTFTVKDMSDPDQVIAWYLGMDADLFKDEPFGLMGYDKVKSFNGIMVCFAPRENEYFKGMGVCVSMSGEGCRTFETMSKLQLDDQREKGSASYAFPALFQLLHVGENCNVSRVDLACDDRFGFLNLSTIVDAVNDNAINSRIQKRTVMTSFNGRQSTGTSVYLGSESSDFRIRIYDKAKEQGDFESHWVRVELVMRGKHANSFVNSFVNSAAVGELAAGILKDKVSFIELDDSNISRCTPCHWWVDFVGSVEAVQLVASELSKHSLDEIVDWVTYQLGPSLALLYQAKGYLQIKEIIDAGMKRMSRKHEAILSDYRGMCSLDNC